MSVKITGGIASGIQLDVPSGKDVRPTGIRARKALFDSLAAGGIISDAVVLDIFAGSGALGLEAASRGAADVYLVEQARRHCETAETNIEKLRKAGVDCDIHIFRGDAVAVLPHLATSASSPDLIFADPPYAKFAFFFKRLMNNANFAEWATGALMIWEYPSHINRAEPKFADNWKIEQIRSFGGTEFIFLRNSG